MTTDDEYTLDPRIWDVIDDIENDETRERIKDAIAVGLNTVDVLLITNRLNMSSPPESLDDVAECLGEGTFTAIVNPTTNALEWEADSTRYDAAWEWFEGDNAFEYTPPERVLVEAMRMNGNLIMHVENPTEEIMLAAVRRNSSAITYIKNPSEAVKRAATMAAAAERTRVSSSGMGDCRVAFHEVTAPSATPHLVLADSDADAVESAPTYVTQGIASLNLLSDFLVSLTIESNNQINNDERHPKFIHVTELDGGLVLSFATMRQLFLMREMFWAAIEAEDLLGCPGTDFDGMEVIAYPSVMGPGLVTWGSAAAVTRVEMNWALQ